MATNIFSSASSGACSTDASFRTWGSAIAAGLLAVGLVKGSDTGQVNWATVLKPAASTSVKGGYEIWRFNDSLQATYPIFVRVDYGTSSSNANNGGLWITVGKGTNGAGTITNTLFAEIQVSTGTANGSSYFSTGDGSMLALAFYPAAGSGSALIVLERSRATNGAADGKAALFAPGIGTASPVTKTANYASGVTYASLHRWPVGIPTASSSDTSLSYGSTGPLFPTIMTDGVGNWWQPRSVLVGMRADTGTLTTITVPVFGTYYVIGSSAIGGWDSQGGIYASPCIWWQ